MHILSPETDNCPSWIRWRERMTIENTSWSISTKACCRPDGGRTQPVRLAGIWSGSTRAWQIQVSATCPAFHSILKMARSYNIPCIFYTFFWASEIKNHLPSQNLDLSLAAGQCICQALVYTVCSSLPVSIFRIIMAISAIRSYRTLIHKPVSTHLRYIYTLK